MKNWIWKVTNRESFTFYDIINIEYKHTVFVYQRDTRYIEGCGITSYYSIWFLCMATLCARHWRLVFYINSRIARRNREYAMEIKDGHSQKPRAYFPTRVSPTLTYELHAGIRTGWTHIVGVHTCERVWVCVRMGMRTCMRVSKVKLGKSITNAKT